MIGPAVRCVFLVTSAQQTTAKSLVSSASYGVFRLASDPPHWSVDGR